MLLVSSWLLLAQLSRFESRGLTGTMVIENLAGTKRHVIKAERAKQPFAPASTFKIPHTRIALEEKAAAGPEETFRWDGTKRDFPLPHHDQTLASACKVSCVWCCQILASRLSQDICRWHLKRLNHGRITPQFALPHFWLNTELQINAEDQIRFLRGIVNHEFPSSPGSPEMTALEFVSELCVVHAKQVRYGRVQSLYVHRVLDDVV